MKFSKVVLGRKIGWLPPNKDVGEVKLTKLLGTAAGRGKSEVVKIKRRKKGDVWFCQVRHVVIVNEMLRLFFVETIH